MSRLTLTSCLLAILLSGCETTSPYNSPDKTAVPIQSRQLPSSYISASPARNTLQQAQKEYFKLEPTDEVNALPDSRIPVLEFEAAMLSDVLIQLLKTVNLKLGVEDDLQDKRLYDLSIAGNFDRALAKLARESGFLYRLEGNTLYLTETQKFKLMLPPLGVLNKPLSQETYRFLISDLASILKERPVFEHDQQQAWLELTVNTAQRRQVEDYITAFKDEKQLIVYKGSLLQFEKPLKPFRQTIYADDKKFQATQHAALTVEQLKALSPVKEEQPFLASIITGYPLNVTFKCKDKTTLKLDMQPKWTGKKLKNNIFISNCDKQQDTLSLESMAGDNQLLLLSPDTAIVLEPLVLSF